MGKRGPQPFKPSEKQRKLVSLLVAGGISEPAIAKRIGICQNTLRRWFGDELQSGHETKRAENLERLDKAAASGNVTAQKYLDTKFERIGAKATLTAPAERVGKKEIVRATALTAGENSEWGDDLAPPSDALPN